MDGGIKVLRAMVDKGPMRPHDIRRASGRSSQAVNHHLKRLVRVGVVIKEGETYCAQPTVSGFNLDFLTMQFSMLGRAAVDETVEVEGIPKRQVVLASLWALVDLVQDELKEQK